MAVSKRLGHSLAEKNDTTLQYYTTWTKTKGTIIADDTEPSNNLRRKHV